MIDKFDSDGRRFIVAVKNDPVHQDTRGLTARERQVAEWVGLGKSSTEVAYILGVSDAAVTNCTARAQEKLGLHTRAELVSFFAQDGLRRKLAETAVAGETLLVGAYPLIDERAAATLTPVEHAMVAQMVAGSTNADIASRHGVSERTVANQVQSIFTTWACDPEGSLLCGCSRRGEALRRAGRPSSEQERVRQAVGLRQRLLRHLSISTMSYHWFQYNGRR
jgi:DNA-binding CsgD family transcriptional regulator